MLQRVLALAHSLTLTHTRSQWLSFDAGRSVGSLNDLTTNVNPYYFSNNQTGGTQFRSLCHCHCRRHSSMRLVALDAIESLIVTTTVQQWIWGDGARAGFFLNDSAPGIPNTVYTGVGDLSMVASRHCWLHSQLRPPAHLLSHHHHYHHHTHHDLQSNIFYKWKDMSSLCSVQACGSAGYWGKEITVTGTTGYQFAPEVDPETAPPPSYVMGGALAPSVVLADCRSINEYRRFVVWSSELLRPFNILTTPVVPSLKVQGLLVDRYRIDNAYVVWCLLAATSLSLSLLRAYQPLIPELSCEGRSPSTKPCSSQ